MNNRLAATVHEKAPSDYRKQLEDLQFRLFQLQVAYHRQGLRAIIILEGWDAAGKGGLIRRATAELDPRFFEVVPIAAPNEMERREHYLERFWREFPQTGNWTIFDRSWYGRVLVERIEEFATPEEWGRAYAEINATEAMLVAAGTRVIKLFLHVNRKKQVERLIDRMEQPWKRWKVTAEDFRNITRREAYVQAYEDMFARTDTPHAPWCIIGADHKKYARIAGMSRIIAALSEGVDLRDPPLDPRLHKMAEKVLRRRVRPR